MGRVYDICHSDGLRWHDTVHKPNFTKIGAGVETIKVLPQKFEAFMLVLLMEGIYVVRR
jgi:hypothetical protein